MRIALLPSSPGKLLGLVTGVVAAVSAIDAGSIIWIQSTVPDDVRRAGQVAAAAVGGQPLNRQTAQLAFDAASAETRQQGLVVFTKDFTIYPDGRVTLTAGKTAPTLLLKRVAALSHFAEVQTTVTVEKLPYS